MGAGEVGKDEVVGVVVEEEVGVEEQKGAMVIIMIGEEVGEAITIMIEGITGEDTLTGKTTDTVLTGGTTEIEMGHLIDERFKNMLFCFVIISNNCLNK